jgi:hypothetical protein
LADLPIAVVCAKYYGRKAKRKKDDTDKTINKTSSKKTKASVAEALSQPPPEFAKPL